MSGKKYESDKKSFRIIVDHLKAATFIIGDIKGVTPSNVGQGYIVRRLIRRAIRHGKEIGIKQENWLKEVAEVVAENYEDVYPGIKENLDFVYTRQCFGINIWKIKLFDCAQLVKPFFPKA